MESNSCFLIEALKAIVSNQMGQIKDHLKASLMVVDSSNMDDLK